MKRCIIDKLDATVIDKLFKLSDFGYVTVTNDYEDNCLNVGRKYFSSINNSIVVPSITGKEYFDIIFPINDETTNMLKNHIGQSILHNWGLFNNNFRFLVVTDKNDISLIINDFLEKEKVFDDYIKEEVNEKELALGNNYKSIEYYNNHKNEMLKIEVLNIPNQDELLLSKLDYYHLVKNNPEFKKIQKKLLNIYVFLLLFGFYAVIKTDPLLTMIFILLSIVMLIIIFKKYKKFNKMFIKSKNIKIKKEE
jgi:hypothetical protein